MAGRGPVVSRLADLVARQESLPELPPLSGLAVVAVGALPQLESPAHAEVAHPLVAAVIGPQHLDRHSGLGNQKVREGQRERTALLLPLDVDVEPPRRRLPPPTARR